MVQPARLAEQEQGFLSQGQFFEEASQGPWTKPGLGDMQKVFVADDLIEANFVRDLLSRDGVATEVDDEDWLRINALPPSVWIMEDAQFRAALLLVMEYERNKKDALSLKQEWYWTLIQGE